MKIFHLATFGLSLILGGTAIAATEVERQARRAIAKIDCTIADLEKEQPVNQAAISEQQSKRRVTARLWKAKGIEVSETPYLGDCQTESQGFDGDWEYRDIPKSGTLRIKGKVVEYIPGDTIPASCSALFGMINEETAEEIRGVWAGICDDLHAFGAFIMKRDADAVTMTECMMLNSTGATGNECELGGYYRDVIRMTSAESEEKLGKIIVVE